MIPSGMRLRDGELIADWTALMLGLLAFAVAGVLSVVPVSVMAALGLPPGAGAIVLCGVLMVWGCATITWRLPVYKMVWLGSALATAAQLTPFLAFWPPPGSAALPRVPIVVVVAVFYGLPVAAGCCIVCTTVAVIRRRSLLREFAGLCGDCGYDLSACNAGPCPECGSALGPLA